MADGAKNQRMTHAEYVAFEIAACERHEFVNGEVYAMAGGSRAHAQLIMNLTLSLGPQLAGRPCRPTHSSLRFHVEASGSTFYPDLGVVCGDFEGTDSDPHAVTNPTVLFEVLSPSTADYDRGAKFDHYMLIPSLKTYVVVYQDRRRIAVSERDAQDRWTRTNYDEGEVPLPTIGASLSLEAVYADL